MLDLKNRGVVKVSRTLDFQDDEVVAISREDVVLLEGKLPMEESSLLMVL